ncbi:glycosyltransferase family 4 protein [Micromonospora thermarum]|uniref:Glycosyltransferase family 4 protein n=1 Tax=Micromonospora thermarum TaxID=2720024 RepID=A0ABX0Z9Q3_9ACTN|nr:glycosyltransferase family 4 protein [Micromonospora thermarum]NJP32630.1 glycosyltransferase family 4 protein [Micromonospora thermarum]
MVDATAPGCDRVTVYHCDAWVARMTDRRDVEVVRANAELLSRAARTTPTVGGARMRYVPVPIPRGKWHMEIARRNDDALRAALGGAPIDAPVVHAHVGLPGGWAAVRNARPDARVYVTEHATFLDSVLDTEEAREAYDEVITRSAGFYAVGEAVRGPLLEAFPHHKDKIEFIANPVDFGDGPTRTVTRLSRWIYVGGLIQRKGVELLLEAFATCRADDPTLTLTMVGAGELLGRLTERAAELGVADAVTFTGALPPDEALRLMGEHDLLVHPSRMETFGVTVVEALAAGMPVLVTRCGGPEETLAGIEEAAGELIDVTDDPATIVTGYRRLRDRFPHGTDVARARTELAARYSYPAVAREHHRIWFPESQSTTSQAERLAGQK